MKLIQVDDFFCFDLHAATILNGMFSLLLCVISIIEMKPIPLDILGLEPVDVALTVYITGEPSFNSLGIAFA